MNKEEMSVLHKATMVLAKSAPIGVVRYFEELCGDVIRFMEGEDMIRNKLNDFSGVVSGEQFLTQTPELEEDLPPPKVPALKLSSAKSEGRLGGMFKR